MFSSPANSAEPLEALKSALSLSESSPRVPAAGDEGARAPGARGLPPRGAIEFMGPATALMAVPTPLPTPTVLLTALARLAPECTRVSMKVASSADAVGSEETALPSS